MCKPGQEAAKKDAQTDATNVQKAFDEGGAKAAYKILDDQQKENQKNGLSAEDTKAWNDEMTKQLKEKGILPELAVAHVEANAKDFKNRQNQYDNSIDVDRVENAALKAQIDGNSLHKELLDSFNSQYEQLRDKEGHRDGAYTPGLSGEDLTKYLDERGKNARENHAINQQRNEDKKWAKEFADEGFFKTLDGYNDNNKKDGHISKGDLDKFLKDVKEDPDIAKRFTPEQIKAAEEARKAFDRKDSEDQKKGGLIQDGGYLGLGTDTITRDSISKGLGYQNMEDMKAKLPKELEKTPEAQPEVAKQGNKEISQEEQKKVVEGLAKDPDLLKKLTDANGVITKEKVDELFKTILPKDVQGPQQLTEAQRDIVSKLHDSYNKLPKDGKGNVTAESITKGAFGASETFDHQLRMQKNHEPTQEEMTNLKKQLEDPKFLARVTNKDGKITPESLAAAALPLKENDKAYTPEQKAALATLNDSYNVLAKKDGKADSIDPKADVGAKIKDKPKEPSEADKKAVEEKLAKEVEAAMTVKKGEGYWHTAARILAIGKEEGYKPTNQEIWKMTQILQKANDGKMLHPNDNLQKLIEAAKDQYPGFKEGVEGYYKKLLEKHQQDAEKALAEAKRREAERTIMV